MSRPSTLPRWATTGTKIAPTDTFLNEGYDPSKKPPAQVENWWKDLLAQWVGFFNATLGMELFGDGSDGYVTADGVSTVPGFTLSGSTYTATRDTFFVDLTVNAGITLNTQNYRVFGRGTLTNNGHISCDGNSATSSTGSSSRSPGSLTSGGSGGNGGSVGSTNGSNGQTASSGQAYVGGAGGIGGAGVYGPGGGSSSTGGSGSTVGLAGTAGNYRSLIAALSGVAFGIASGSPSLTALGGGGGGGGGYGDDGTGINASNGGGGGAGGGVMALLFYNIVNNGVISVDGGDGAPPQIATGTGSANAGAGAGGGGGMMWLFHCGMSGTGTVTANKGQPGSGGTISPVAQTGNQGHIIEVDLSLDGTSPSLGPHKERGLVTFSTGSSGAGYDFVDVTFAQGFDDLNYTFNFSQSLTSGSDPVPMTMINQTRYGFRLQPVAQFSGRVSWECEAL